MPGKSTRLEVLEIVRRGLSITSVMIGI